MKKMNEKNTGFTLIELMIVVAIVGILAGIAYPSYQDSGRKSRRADAEGALLGFANAMERYFTENNTYLGAAGTPANPADTGAPQPSIFAKKSPIDGGKTFYNLTINAPPPPPPTPTPAPTPTTYTLYAIPTGHQANDKCGTLTLTETGKKGILHQATGVTVKDCW